MVEDLERIMDLAGFYMKHNELSDIFNFVILD